MREASRACQALLLFKPSDYLLQRVHKTATWRRRVFRCGSLWNTAYASALIAEHHQESRAGSQEEQGDSVNGYIRVVNLIDTLEVNLVNKGSIILNLPCRISDIFTHLPVTGKQLQWSLSMRKLLSDYYLVNWNGEPKTYMDWHAKLHCRESILI